MPRELEEGECKSKERIIMHKKYVEYHTRRFEIRKEDKEQEIVGITKHSFLHVLLQGNKRVHMGRNRLG